MLGHYEDEPVGQHLITLPREPGHHLSARLDLVDAVPAANELELVGLEVVLARLHDYEMNEVILVSVRLIHTLGGANI